MSTLMNITNEISTVYYAYHGIRQNSNHKDAILRNMPYLGIAGVGIGSTIFHATMLNYTQWCKSSDISMIPL
jgi:dihydroceramidase